MRARDDSRLTTLLAAAAALMLALALPVDAPAASDNPSESSDRAADSDSEDEATSEDSGNDSSLQIEVQGVNVVSASAEERLKRDIARKLESNWSRLARCWRRFGPAADDTVTVDWTITTRGEAVGFTVFAADDAIEPCLTRVIRPLRFAHLDDRHPVARVQLRSAR